MSLSSCQTTADPEACIARTASEFYACLRKGDAGGDCVNYDGLATAGDVAESPFPNAEAEILAIEASGAAVAPARDYARIVADLATIRALNPELIGIDAAPSWLANELIIGFDDQGSATVAAGSYTDWDCRNAFYGVSAVEHHSSFTRLHFRHRFNALLLAAEYGSLPNVRYVEPNSLLGDGNDVCASSDGQRYSYVFDAGSGDCPAGCISHTYWGFSTSGTGEVVALGTWANASGNPPTWLTALGACTKWL